MKETDEFLEENFFVSHPFLLFVMPINQTEIEKLKERERKRWKERGFELFVGQVQTNVQDKRQRWRDREHQKDQISMTAATNDKTQRYTTIKNKNYTLF